MPKKVVTNLKRGSAPDVIHVPKVCPKTGRRGFVDWIQAALALEQIQLRARRTIHDERSWYTCRFCSGVHLTTQDPADEEQLPHSA